MAKDLENIKKDWRELMFSPISVRGDKELALAAIKSKRGGVADEGADEEGYDDMGKWASRKLTAPAYDCCWLACLTETLQAGCAQCTDCNQLKFPSLRIDAASLRLRLWHQEHQFPESNDFGVADMAQAL